jgi:2-dehydropantoate 2-reductase
LVVGAGAIGGVTLAALHAGGRTPTVLVRPGATAAALSAGLVVRDRGAEVRVPVRATTSLGPDDRYDLILLATQPTEVEDAARQVAAHLSPGGAVVVMQNGLCERRVAQIVGDDAVLGAVVAFGASVDAPGVVRRTSKGGVVLGRPDGRSDARLAAVVDALAPIGRVDTTHDLLGTRWTKLALNCAISTLGTVGGDRVGPLIARAFVRRLGLEILTEAVVVARAEGVKLQRIAGTFDLDRVALADADRRGPSPSLAVKHALVWAVGAKYRHMRSSMLRAIEQGKPPAIDFLNGEVVSAAARHGLSAPVNSAAVEAVRAFGAGASSPSVEALERLFATTRA